MRKINNRKSLILAAGGGKYVPNIVRGGNAIPLGNNFYYIKGRKHSAGGVDIGADPKTGLEVEGEEVMKVTPKEVRVYSSVPFLQGNSPAELVMGGANPDAVFNAQEEFKDRNRINDDGSKYKNGGKIYDASKNYERAAKAREWTGTLIGLFDPTPISGMLDFADFVRNDRSAAEGVLAALSVLPGSRVLSKLTRGLGRLTKNQSLIKEGKKISDVVNRDKTLQKAISSFNQSARDGTLAERMRRREIYTPGGDIDLDRIQGEHIKNYNKAIHYFDRYNKLSDSNWANYENFEKAKSNAFDRALEDSRLQRKLLKASVQIADPTDLSTSVPAIIKGITGNSVPSDWLDVLGSVPRVRSLSNLLRYRKNRGDFSKAVILKDKENEYRHLADEFVDYATKNIDGKNAEYAKRTIKQANDILKEYRKADKIINPIENAQYAVRGVIQNQDIRDAIDSRANKKPLGGNLPTNQNDFLDTWNSSRLATGRYNNQLGDGRLERQAESRNTAREFHSPIGFAMNYGKRAAIRTPSMSDTDYRKEIARNAQSMRLRLNTPETGQGVIGGAYHDPTHSSYINQEEFAKDATVRTHENAHASRAAEQEQVISDILGSSSSSDYLRRPTEVYSRLMQFRQANNLDPNIIYDKDSFRELRKTATDYNLINTFKEDEVIDLLNNVAMRNDPNQLNLNNINLNTVPVYAAKYGTKRKSKMGKIISINGNVRNGLIHTPSREAFAYGGERKPRFNGRYSKPGLHNLSLLASAIIMPKGTVDKEPEKPRRLGWADLHNRLVTADISQKPLDAKRDNTNVAHTISETERRTRKFQNGGSATYKGKQLYQLPFDPDGLYYQQVDEFGDVGHIKVEDGEWIKENNVSKQSTSSKRNPINIDSIANAKRKDVDDFLINTFNLKPRNYVDGVTGAARRVPTSPQLTRNITNGLANNAPTYKKNGETHYFVEAPKVDYDSGTSLADLQNLLNLTPRKGSNQSSSSSTGGINNRTSKSAKPTIQRVNRLAPATNAEMAGIRRGLEPLLQNTIVDKLNKTVDNDLNVMPVQDDVAKTRNMDNILLGVNLGSSVLDAVMGNIYANQMHGYTAPNITAPTIKNPGEIKLNEEDLKDIPAPILMAAAKLKTRYNANPQLSKIEDETRRTMRDIDRNTSNSRVGLARKQLAALRGQEAKNQVYAQKENIETELINKDKLNQQEVTARNLARYDQYNQALAAQMANRARLRLAADTANIQNRLAVSTANANLKAQADQFNAGNRINSLIHQAGIDGAKAEARANIVSSLLGNVGSAFDVWNRNKRQAKLDEETLKVLGLRAPNVNKLILRTLGINK